MSGVADQQTRDDGMALGHPRAASGGANTQRAVPERLLPWVKASGKRVKATARRCFCRRRRAQPPLTPAAPGRCDSAYIKAQPPTFLSLLEFLILVLAPPGKPYTPLPARLPPPPSLSPPGRPQKSADISYFAAFACWSENLVITRRFSKEVSRQNQQEEKTFSS